MSICVRQDAGGALTRPGERSVQARSDKPSTATENGERNARQARDGQGDGKMWKVCPAGLTRRGTKNEGRRCRPENGEQRTENRERPCGATGETAVQSVDSRKSQASKPLNF